MQWWQALDRRSRTRFILGAAAIVLSVAAAGWWLLRGEQAVLFSDLRPQDAALLAAELDRQKVAYSVADGGSTLLVDRTQVHATRLKVLGKDLPLHGAVGFELFNTSDFGMTEFAQRINYQRALQGELTRTILSFPEVRDARVHLALPEQGLFKQPTLRPKAAVTLTLRPGHMLRPEQVSGVQRLLAAAVPGLAPHEVTIVDHNGVALSRAAAEADGEAAGSARLDLKRETENYLSRKAGAVLERAFGPGQALASVDVTLNMEQVRVTTEDVIAAPDARGSAAAGVLVRERESARDNTTPDVRAANGAGTRGSSVQREVEYQAGRRVEQVVSQPGSIRRLHVVALLRQPLEGEQQEQVRRVVAAAVGASFERGDTVVVQSFGAAPAALAISPSPAAPDAAAAPAVPAASNTRAWLELALVVPVLALIAWVWQRRRRTAAVVAAPRRLDEAQRLAALRRVEAWLNEEPAVRPLDAPPLARGKAP